MCIRDRDGRKGNRGGSTRVRPNVRFKDKHMMHLEEWLHHNPGESVSNCVQAHHPPNRFSCWNNQLSRWRSNSQKPTIIEAAINELCGKPKVKPVDSRFESSPFKLMEEMLQAAIKENRKNGRKVSRACTCIQAKKLQHERDKIDGTTLSSRFKASNG